MTIKVLIADDQALLRTGFRMILESEPDLEVVGEASDGAEAVTEFSGSAPTWCSWTCGCPGWTAWQRRGGSRDTHAC